MHEFDFSVSHFLTRVQGTRIAVIPQIVADALRVPKVEFPDYLGCERLRIVSKDELKFAFCERPCDWGERQFTYCSNFAKGLRFLNMVRTFFLHPLSHYNYITKPRARFLLFFLEQLTIDFLFHFILYIIDVHRDSASCDKLIFPSTITRILCHFSVPFPASDHFSVPFPASDHFSYMCAIDAVTIKHSEVQFRSRQSRSAAPFSHLAPSRSTPSTSAPSSSTSDMSLRDMMMQLQRMDARLDTLYTELY